jgi:hypothetical protein
MQIAASCIALATQVGAAPPALAQATGSLPSVSDEEVRQWVSRRAAAWQPTADERRFDQIGWAADIRDAQRLARKHQRPIFVFTYDGRSIALKRC